MALLVRRLKVMDLPALEQLEAEATARFPGRAGWLNQFHKLIERALSEEPEGILIAELSDKVVGGAIVRQRGAHPLTGLKHGVLYSLTAAPAYAPYNVRQRLLLEAYAYLKSRGCRTVSVSLPADATEDGELYRNAGFQVVAWELERPL